MTDVRVEKLADVLVNYSVAVQPDDKVGIEGNPDAKPLLLAIFERVLHAGGLPFLQVELEEQKELLARYGSDAQLTHIPDPVKLLADTYDVNISIGAASNTRALSNVDPARIAVAYRARTELRKTVMRRSAAGELRWTSTLYPTNAYAQDAGMSLSEYEDFVYGACMPDMKDPVGYWHRLSARHQKIVDWLAGKERVHIVGPGTDLHLSITGRTFINSDGKHNMPSGEVFTGPVEDSAEGHVRFSYPAVYEAREVAGVQLWFERGKVVRASAEKDQGFLLRMLETDEGAQYLGEFGIGTNEGITRFTKQILFDEKIAGSFHLALGAGYPETGSVNESAIHWDMICDLRDGGEIWVDDKLLHKDGEFVIEF